MDPQDRYGGFAGYGGPGQFDGGSGHFAHDPWAALLFTTVSLAWLLAPVLIAMAYLWYHNHRAALANRQAAQTLVDDEPSSFELLRRRYVVGEIDTPTFEVMTERLLISERAEEQHPALARPASYDRYLRRAPKISQIPEEYADSSSTQKDDDESGSEPRVIWL